MQFYFYPALLSVTFIFRCSDGTCIDLSLRCDFYPDCVDGEDEDCGKVYLHLATMISCGMLKEKLVEKLLHSNPISRP